MKKKLLRSLASVFLLPLFAVPFVKVFSLVIKEGGKITLNDKYNLVDNYADAERWFEGIGKTFHSFWMLATFILVILLLAAALAYVVSVVYNEYVKENYMAQIMIKYSKYVVLGLGVLAVITGLVGCLTNNVTGTDATGVWDMKVHLQAGYYLIALSVISGVIAIIADIKEKEAQ